MKRNMKNKRYIRHIVQAAFLILITAISVNKGLVDSGGGIGWLSQASLHALCPFGGVVSVYNLATLGTFVKKIHASSVILMSLILFLAALFGPVFCGWVCPLGSVQEWIGKAGKRVFGNKLNSFIPQKVDKGLGYVRYAVLIMVVFVTARSGYLVFENVDPYNALFSFWREDVALPAMIILGATLTLSLFTSRPWCKYACPYGAMLGLFNKIRFFKIRRNNSTCVNCKKCDRSCPMNIDVSKKDAVTDVRCISCYECTSEINCPVKDTVNMSAGKGAVQIRPMIMAVFVPAVIFGGISATIAADVWNTTSSKMPKVIESGESAGEYSPADIRGSYTFSEVSDLYGIELKVLYEAFGIPEGTDGAVMKVKDLEAMYADYGAKIGTESLQVFVALYRNLTIPLGDAMLPKRAAELLLQAKPNLTAEQRAYIETHTAASGQPGAVAPVPEKEEAAVTGSTTFQQLLDSGLTRDQIEGIIGVPMPSSNQTVKDFCTEAGLVFSDVKAQLNSLYE